MFFLRCPFGALEAVAQGGQLPKEIGIDPDTAEGDTNDDNADPYDPWAWTC
jgi:hypothetical protein